MIYVCTYVCVRACVCACAVCVCVFSVCEGACVVCVYSVCVCLCVCIVCIVCEMYFCKPVLRRCILLARPRPRTRLKTACARSSPACSTILTANHKVNFGSVSISLLDDKTQEDVQKIDPRNIFQFICTCFFCVKPVGLII